MGADPGDEASTNAAGGAPRRDLVAELEELTRLERLAPDLDRERRIVALRHAAFDELDRSPGRSEWPGDFPDPFPGETAIPTITPGELSSVVLGGAIVHHGCLRVDGLLAPDVVARFRGHIDRGFEARERLRRGEPREAAAPWFVPFEPGRSKADGFGQAGFIRAVDVPRALCELVDVFAETGVRDAVAEYFNERPAMIANKWVLRRTETGKVGPDLHQDGAFLGEGIRTVDCWISLSHCGPGTGKPGLDLVPRRFGGILPSTEDSAFPWSVTEATVRAASEGTEMVSPVFAPGDAFFFDERLPHRTSVGLELTTRYAIESWFVAPSSYPAKHVPVVL